MKIQCAYIKLGCAHGWKWPVSFPRKESCRMTNPMAITAITSVSAGASLRVLAKLQLTQSTRPPVTRVPGAQNSSPPCAPRYSRRWVFILIFRAILRPSQNRRGVGRAQCACFVAALCSHVRFASTTLPASLSTGERVEMHLSRTTPATLGSGTRVLIIKLPELELCKYEEGRTCRNRRDGRDGRRICHPAAFFPREIDYLLLSMRASEFYICALKFYMRARKFYMRAQNLAIRTYLMYLYAAKFYLDQQKLSMGAE